MFSYNEILAKNKGYRVDKYGNAFDKNNNTVGRKSNRGYLYFAFKSKDNKVIKVYVHRLQAYQKYGKRIYKEGIVVRHLNGNAFDNSRNNIAIGTMLDNHYDKPYNERRRSIERLIKCGLTANVKYDEAKVQEIYQKHLEGVSYNQLMKEYNISSKGTLSYIINKRSIAGGV